MTWNWLIVDTLLTASCLIGNAQNPSLPSPSPIALKQQSLPSFPPQPGNWSFPYEDRCGNPAHESSLWTVIEGRVIEVSATNAIRIVLDDGKRKHVSLTPIEPFNEKSQASEGRRRLADLVSNKRVEVLSLGKERRGKMTAIVTVDNRDVNLVLIESGMARFREPESYSMSSYTACVYRITADQARESRRGLWR